MRTKYLLGSIGLSALVLFAGCSAVLPQRKAHMESYIPSTVAELNPNTSLKQEPLTGSNDFLSKNFPKNCEWDTVGRVVDGDTIELSDKTRVRLIGIDTPETVHPDKPVEPWGPEASRLTKSLLPKESSVCLFEDKTQGRYDSYGRRLAYVVTHEGIDIQREQLQQGLARVMTSMAGVRESEFFILEKEAKEAQKNRWETQ